MKIVADKSIPFIRHYFTGLGDLCLVDGREISNSLLRDADILVARTVTPVDEPLLRDTKVRFVANPASGADHVDLDYLAAAGIGYAGAPGCNARSVAEYVLSALCVLAELDSGLRRNDEASVSPAKAGAQSDEKARGGMIAGVIGCGAVGSMVVELLEAVGIECLRNDPPLSAATHDPRYLDLHELRDADILTLHVPLTRSGPHATCGLVDEQLLARLKPGVVIINTSRGEVMDEAALCRFLDRHARATAILDVWAGEPDINSALHSRTRFGTPHIAGYSADARLRATAAVAERARTFLGRNPGELPTPVLPAPASAGISIAPGVDAIEAVRIAVLAAYDVRRDAEPLRRIGSLDATRRAAYFSSLRENYPVRREFPAYTVRTQESSAARMLGALGFAVKTDA